MENSKNRQYEQDKPDNYIMGEAKIWGLSICRWKYTINCIDDSHNVWIDEVERIEGRNSMNQ